jgi:hypothetical protein
MTICSCCLKCEGVVELHEANNRGFHLLAHDEGSMSLCCDEEKLFGYMSMQLFPGRANNASS